MPDASLPVSSERRGRDTMIEPVMSVIQETQPPMGKSQAEINLTTPSERRDDIDAKQALVVELAKEQGCDGILTLLPENFTWLTAGGVPRGIVDLDTLPGLYISAEGRWLL